jgi:gamma-glutamylcyclotransferase (GGCT)/AIG2-like uncharacterized protein YtfP
MSGCTPLDAKIDRTQWVLIGTGRIRAILYDLGAYPGAVSTREQGRYVHGEVYRISDIEQALPVLDEYEVYFAEGPGRSLFLRGTSLVELDSGEEVHAFVYFYNQDVRGSRVIPTGRWKETT